MPVITVSQINRYIAFILKGDRNLGNVMIKGEISNFVLHSASGHMYFTLKDSGSSIKAVMFSQAASRLKFLPEDGMSVIASGNIAVFERDGIYQLYVNDIIPEGAGKAVTALEQLKKKLEAQGIFDPAHKRPLPEFPKRIGAVTSLTGAAVKDIINVLSRRYPIGELYAVNAVVQGEEAPDSVCMGILRAEAAGCDVIIVGRGGGSSEDLGAFNSEKVAYGIYNCKVPVISAVGHERDYTIADLAADMRAPTPSAAAELAAPPVDLLYERIGSLSRRSENAAFRIFDKSVDRFITLNARLSAQAPEERMKAYRSRLENLSYRGKTAILRYMERCDAELAKTAAKLESLSPVSVLARGYSLVYGKNGLINSTDKLDTDDIVRIRFGKGEAEAKIINVVRK